ncbi:hypothetical protein [Nocardia paucivorans]|uniref:hypothetical protein n=1 Tax=Nocardia paucivorans TaxID=114259 RepID=UPI000314ABD2|nr:hypothetical protein [Nocardia paucivorans]
MPAINLPQSIEAALAEFIEAARLRTLNPDTFREGDDALRKLRAMIALGLDRIAAGATDDTDLDDTAEDAAKLLAYESVTPATGVGLGPDLRVLALGKGRTVARMIPDVAEEFAAQMHRGVDTEGGAALGGSHHSTDRAEAGVARTYPGLRLFGVRVRFLPPRVHTD